MLKQLIPGIFIVLSSFIPAWATAQPATAEKNQYHLFNPTPKENMRDISTDRPDKTESPYTVDAGHYQIELSFLDYSYNHRHSENSDIRTDSYTILPTNFKIGLLNNVDLQLVTNPYLIERSKGDGEKDKKEGTGDLQTRLKVNLWGNDGGTTALAIMPFIKFPTNTNEFGNDDVEGGIIIPLAIALPHDWSLGLMTEFDFNRSGGDYLTEYINTITLGHSIIGNLSGYIEFFSSFDQEPDSPWVGTVDTGVTYALTKDIQFDAGVNIGVTRSADDFNPFCGVTLRY